LFSGWTIVGGCMAFQSDKCCLLLQFGEVLGSWWSTRYLQLGQQICRCSCSSLQGISCCPCDPIEKYLESINLFVWCYLIYCVLLLQRALLNGDKNFDQYKQEAENFMCKILPNSPSSSTQYTQGKGNNTAEFQRSDVTQLGQSKCFCAQGDSCTSFLKATSSMWLQ